MNFVTKTQNIKIKWIKETESALFISLCFGLRSISKFTSTAIKWSIKFRKNINDHRFYYGIGFAYFGPFKCAFECVLNAKHKISWVKTQSKSVLVFIIIIIINIIIIIIRFGQTIRAQLLLLRWTSNGRICVFAQSVKKVSLEME